MSLLQLIELNSNKEVNDNKDVKVSAVKDRKISITTTSVIPTKRKLSIALIKMTLLKDRQDVRVKKV